MDRLVNLTGSNVCVVVLDAASQLLRLPQLLASLPVDGAAAMIRVRATPSTRDHRASSSGAND